MRASVSVTHRHGAGILLSSTARQSIKYQRGKYQPGKYQPGKDQSAKD